jgi:hypothetical protein
MCFPRYTFHCVQHCPLQGDICPSACACFRAPVSRSYGSQARLAGASPCLSTNTLSDAFLVCLNNLFNQQVAIPDNLQHWAASSNGRRHFAIRRLSEVSSIIPERADTKWRPRGGKQKSSRKAWEREGTKEERDWEAEKQCRGRAPCVQQQSPSGGAPPSLFIIAGSLISPSQLHIFSTVAGALAAAGARCQSRRKSASLLWAAAASARAAYASDTSKTHFFR